MDPITFILVLFLAAVAWRTMRALESIAQSLRRMTHKVEHGKVERRL